MIEPTTEAEAEARPVSEDRRAKTVVVLSRCILTLSRVTDELVHLAEALAEMAEELQRDLEGGAR